MSNHFVTCDSVNGFHTFLPATENWFIKKPVRSWEMQKAFKIKGKKKGNKRENKEKQERRQENSPMSGKNIPNKG